MEACVSFQGLRQVDRTNIPMTDKSTKNLAEWIETDGLGGFASGTVCGQRTRRYHGLLLVARNPPAERVVLVNGFDAWLRVRGSTAEATREARGRFLKPLQTHIEQAGIGHISEICDAETPHTPRGCPFQAWSLGEYLRMNYLVLGAALREGG